MTPCLQKIRAKSSILTFLCTDKPHWCAVVIRMLHTYVVCSKSVLTMHASIRLCWLSEKNTSSSRTLSSGWNYDSNDRQCIWRDVLSYLKSRAIINANDFQPFENLFGQLIQDGEKDFQSGWKWFNIWWHRRGIVETFGLQVGAKAVQALTLNHDGVLRMMDALLLIQSSDRIHAMIVAFRDCSWRIGFSSLRDA